MRPPTRRQSWLLLLIAVGLLLGIGVLSQPHGPSAAKGDRIAATGDLVLKPGDVIERDAIAVLGNVVVPAGARVKHDVQTGRGSVEIAGTVDNDVRAVDGDVTLDASAVVGRDVTIRNGQLHRDPGAVVHGTVSVTTRPEASAAGDPGLLGLFVRLVINLVVATVLVAMGTLAVLAWPRQTGRVASTLESAPWPSAVIGLLTAVLILPVAIVLTVVLAITIVGVLLVPVVWLAVLLGWLVGLVGLGLWVGRRLADSGHMPLAQGSLLVTAAVGLAVVVGLPLLLGVVLPWLGATLAYFAGFLGLGAVVLARLGGAAARPRLTVHGEPRVTAPLQPPDRKAS